MSGVWTILGADTDQARIDAKDAGCTHAVINAYWDNIQPTGTGQVSTTGINNFIAAFDHAVSLGLKPIISINPHYPPLWVQNGVEKFKDQSGNEYVNSNASGKNVRNWIWTQTGRNYLEDFTRRTINALGEERKALIDGCRIGMGWYGEVHYPTHISGNGLAWQAFGQSMQTGTDLAAGMEMNPVPGYVPFTGTDEQDVQFLNWYLNGLVKAVKWQVSIYKSLGLTRNLWVLTPGWGIRTNQSRSESGYRSSAAVGEDHIRLISELADDPAVWFCSTWLNNADSWANGDTADSSKSAWKSLYEKSLLRGKHHRLIGENTEKETNESMDAIFSSALGNATYPGSPGQPEVAYFRGCAWLDYTSLKSGGNLATLQRYKENIATKQSS